MPALMTDPTASAIAIALTRVPFARLEYLGFSPAEALALPDADWCALGGYSSPYEALAHRAEAIGKAAAEARFIEAKRLKVLTPLDPQYPRRLLAAPAVPRMLTVFGNADLNAERMLSIVGTRHATPYGLHFTETLTEELREAAAPVTIVSGLAYGIDAAAHRAALKTGMPTVAVVAHGMGMIYPAAHRDLARRIVEAGGAIVTTYLHDAKAFRGHFLERNVVIATLSDATLIVESDFKGGAMSTAAHALDAGRDVLALPGRNTDKTSAGCNHLIRTRRAELVTSARDVMDTIGWKLPKKTKKKAAADTPSLFPTLSPLGEKIASALSERNEAMTLDELTVATGIPIHKLMAETADMEFHGHLLRYPGGRIMLCL